MNAAGHNVSRTITAGRRRAAHRIVRSLAVVLALFWFSHRETSHRVSAAETSEEQVKAAFLINFPKYADWPAETFATSNSPIVIAVLGETKVSDEIQKAIAGRTINGREIILKHLASGDEPCVCQILFICAAEERHSPDLLARFKDTSTLTVGESDDFLENGGIINLARRDRKIALEVNLTAASNARIKISSKLLSVANVVKGKSR
jgi:hypothetical protein